MDCASFSSRPAWAYSTDVEQAVSVREPLPPTYHIAGVGHMNTWGQQTSELYLALVATTAQLAGARHLLIANEVNPADITGALKDLRIPYLVTNGNHTVGRWLEFFGPRTFAVDDGPLRLVAFNDRPDQSWGDVEDLLVGRPGASSRVVVAYEGYAPVDMIRRSGVDLLLTGTAPAITRTARTFRRAPCGMRAPTQETMRWIAMNHGGFSPTVTATNSMVQEIQGLGPRPARRYWSFPAQGPHRCALSIRSRTTAARRQSPRQSSTKPVSNSKRATSLRAPRRRRLRHRRQSSAKLYLR